MNSRRLRSTKPPIQTIYTAKDIEDKIREIVGQEPDDKADDGREETGKVINLSVLIEQKTYIDKSFFNYGDKMKNLFGLIGKDVQIIYDSGRGYDTTSSGIIENIVDGYVTLVNYSGNSSHIDLKDIKEVSVKSKSFVSIGKRSVS